MKRKAYKISGTLWIISNDSLQANQISLGPQSIYCPTKRNILSIILSLLDCLLLGELAPVTTRGKTSFKL